jgi:ArsR family metal-binding transcriptional regulator
MQQRDTESKKMEEHIVRREGYSFYLVNIDCLRTSTEFNVVMDLEASIQDLLPYLAACLPGCNYVHGSDVIDLMDAGHIVGIYPKQVTMTSVAGLEEADRLCGEYFERILDSGRRKDEIEPVYRKRSTLGVLDILRALPGTNCGVCACPTCMAFAAQVFRRETEISACPPFMDDLEKHEDLLEKLRAQGYRVPAVDRPTCKVD